jgi:hypothetical protein
MDDVQLVFLSSLVVVIVTMVYIGISISLSRGEPIGGKKKKKK